VASLCCFSPNEKLPDPPKRSLGGFERVPVGRQKQTKLDRLNVRFNNESLFSWLCTFRMGDSSGRAVEEWVCGCLLAGFAGSNPAGGMDVCLVRVLFVVRYTRLGQAESYRVSS
jgi:hypothetical protein